MERPAVSGQRIRALRHAREIVDGMRWRGIAVPQLYANMASEFQALVLSGHYAAWLTAPDEAGHASVDGEAYQPGGAMSSSLTRHSRSASARS